MCGVVVWCLWCCVVCLVWCVLVGWCVVTGVWMLCESGVLRGVSLLMLCARCVLMWCCMMSFGLGCHCFGALGYAIDVCLLSVRCVCMVLRLVVCFVLVAGRLCVFAFTFPFRCDVSSSVFGLCCRGLPCGLH